MAAKVELMTCPVEVFEEKSNFDHWKEKMENFFRAIKVAEVVRHGFVTPTLEEAATLTEPQKAVVEQNRMKDELAKMWITMRVSPSVYEKIMHAENSKKSWDMLANFFQGNDRVKKVRLQALHRKFELSSI